MASRAAIQQIKSDEGTFKSAKKDSLGVLTIGRGFNLEQEGAEKMLLAAGVPKEDVPEVMKEGGKSLTSSQSDMLFSMSLSSASKRVKKLVNNHDSLPSEVKDVLLNMSFQLGNRLKDFTKFLGNVDKGDFKAAGEEMLNSLWAKQTPNRAKRLSKMVTKVKEPTTAIGQKSAMKAQYERELFNKNADEIASSLSRDKMIDALAGSISKQKKAELDTKVAKVNDTKETPNVEGT